MGYLRDAVQDKVTKQHQKIYNLETNLEKEKRKNLKLTAQLYHDYENSSLPSSMSVERNNIPIFLSAKHPQIGTILKNHIQSSSCLFKTILLFCSESDTSLMNSNTEA